MRYHLSKKVIRWEEIAYYFVHCVSRKCHVQNVSGFVINIYTDAAKGSRNCCICKVYSEYITMEMRLEREVNIWGPEIYVHYYIKVRHKMYGILVQALFTLAAFDKCCNMIIAAPTFFERLHKPLSYFSFFCSLPTYL